jgi:putative RNA 2'-phosphotransferase
VPNSARQETDPRRYRRTSAHAVGGRRRRPLILVIAAGRMHRDGHLFYLSANDVWLTEAVPPGYITVRGA